MLIKNLMMMMIQCLLYAVLDLTAVSALRVFSDGLHFSTASCVIVIFHLDSLGPITMFPVSSSRTYYDIKCKVILS